MRETAMNDAIELPGEREAVDLARECVYRFLAWVLRDPYSAEARPWLDPGDRALAALAAELLRAEALAHPAALGFAELPPEQLTLQPLLAHLSDDPAAFRREYDRVFGLVISKECPPYETEYHPAKETFQRSQELADIAGFYRAFGLQPAAACPERPDHIALECEFMAFLLLKKRLVRATPEPAGRCERSEVCGQAERAFFADHLAWWVPAFARGLRRKAEDGLFEAVGQLLGAFIAVERGLLAVPAPRLPVQAALIERPEEQAGCTGCTIGL